MNLENENKEYLKLQKDIEDAKKYIEAKKKDLDILLDDRTIHNAELIKARRAKDSALEATEKKEVEKLDKAIEALKTELEEKRKELTGFEISLNMKIQMVMEDPEMKDEISKALKERYDRKRKKEERKAEKIIILMELIDKHPSLENNLTGILVAKDEIRKLEKELNELDPKSPDYLTRKTEIETKLLPAAGNKLKTNKNLLMAYMQKNKIDIKEEDLDEIAERRAKRDDHGRIDAKLTLERDLANTEKNIRRYEHMVDKNNIELENNNPVNNGPAFPAEKPKWYQFGKRFKNWLENRKQQALPASNPQPTTRKKGWKIFQDRTCKSCFR